MINSKKSITFFWGTMPYQEFGGTFCLHHQGRILYRKRKWKGKLGQ